MLKPIKVLAWYKSDSSVEPDSILINKKRYKIKSYRLEHEGFLEDKTGFIYTVEIGSEKRKILQTRDNHWYLLTK